MMSMRLEGVGLAWVRTASGGRRWWVAVEVAGWRGVRGSEVTSEGIDAGPEMG